MKEKREEVGKERKGGREEKERKERISDAKQELSLYVPDLVIFILLPLPFPLVPLSSLSLFVTVFYISILFTNGAYPSSRGTVHRDLLQPP